MFYNRTAEDFIDYNVYSKQIMCYDLNHNIITLTYNNITVVSEQYNIEYKKLHGFYIEYKIVNGKETRLSVDNKLFTDKRFIDNTELYDKCGNVVLLNHVNSHEISKQYNIPVYQYQHYKKYCLLEKETYYIINCL